MSCRSGIERMKDELDAWREVARKSNLKFD